MNTEDTPINWQEILEITNNKLELSQDLLIMLGKDLPQIQNTINVSFKNKDINTLLENIHKLNGSCCYCGLNKLKLLSTKLENQLNNDSKLPSKKQIDILNNEISEVLQYLKEQNLL